MKKVILINPPSNCIEDDRLEPQLGLLYIASVLREGNVPVEIYEMTGCQTEEQIQNKIKKIPEGDVFGFTTYCTNYAYVKRCINYIRKNVKKALIVLGGPNPTALPEFTVEDSKCDCVVVGEGEDALLNLVRAYDSGDKIHSIIKGVGKDDIDKYSFPAWDLVDLSDYHRIFEGERVISLVSSRGCKFNCIHCNSIIMGRGNKVRYRSSENIVKEINILKNKKYRKFRFNDDNFASNPNLKELLHDIKGLNVSYRIFTRIEDLTEENCYLLADSNCHHISVGLESLNPDNLKVLRKFSQCGLEKKNLANARKYGITIRAYFMVGLPFDNNKNIREYSGKACELDFDEFSIYPLIPYPGTKIADNPSKYGYEIVDKDFTHYIQIGKHKSTSYALRHKNFTENDVRDWKEYVEKLFLSSGKLLQKQSKIAL